MNQSKYNILFAFVSHFLMAFSAAWAVVEVIFYQDLNLNFVEIAILFSLANIVTLIFEVPTGVFTDLYGRKISILAAFALCIVAGVTLIYSDSFLDVAIVGVIYGLSFSFWSGSFEALLFESLANTECKYTYTEIFAKSNFIFTSLGVLTNYLIPKIYGIDMRYPFYLTVFVGAILFIMTLFLSEPNHSKTHENKPSFFEQVRFSFDFIKERKNLMFIIYYTSIWTTLLSIFGALLNQPFVHEHYEMSDYGIVFAASTLIQSTIIYFTKPILDFLKPYNIYFLLTTVWSGLLLLMTMTADSFWFLPVAMGGTWSIGSLVYILVSNDLNHIIVDDNVRATVLSFKSMFNSLIVAVGLLLYGVVIEAVNDMKISLFILSALGFALSTIILFKAPKTIQ